jgi:hypothetical protein
MGSDHKYQKEGEWGSLGGGGARGSSEVDAATSEGAVEAEQGEKLGETEMDGEIEGAGEERREEVDRERGRGGRCSGPARWCHTITMLSQSVSLTHGVVFRCSLPFSVPNPTERSEVGSAFVFLGSVAGTTSTFSQPVSSLHATSMNSVHATAISRVRFGLIYCACFIVDWFHVSSKSSRGSAFCRPLVR